MLNNKKIAIIGGGIGGLATGCYLQMNGYKTTIFEKNSMCGGVSVAWKRGAYLFDGSAEWFVGSSPSSNMYHLMREVIDLSEQKIINSDIFITIEHCGKQLRVYKDADKLRGELMRIASEDKILINQFCDAIKELSQYALPFDFPTEQMNIFQQVKFLFSNLDFIRFYSKWKRITMRKYSDRFSNVYLRAMLKNIYPKHDYFSVFAMMVALGWMHAGSAGYIIGGSNKVNDEIIKKYMALGGTLRLNSPVKKIVVKNDSATAVILNNGEIFNADDIIAATDLLHTHKNLLNGKYLSKKEEDNLASRDVYQSVLMVSLGVARRFPDEPHNMCITLDEPIKVGNTQMMNTMMVRLGDEDSNFAPKDKSTIIARFRISEQQYWVDLRKTNREQYKKEKMRIAEETIVRLEKRFGPIRKLIEEVDVATPATYVRYTNIYKASFQGWAPVPKMIGKTLSKTVKGLEHFYFSGQWIWPAGGIAGVVRMGRHLAQIMCHRDKKMFMIK